MNLLLTLGHNSSAILVNDEGEVLCGYENERITRIKSDSQFPQAAIEEIRKHHEIPEHVTIYVSHWFINGILPDTINKYWNPIYLNTEFPDCVIMTVGRDFTHHDAHAWSATAFVGDHLKDALVIVADGFGNFGETMSIYQRDGTKLNILKRAFGFDTSLGLLYQYATSYLGMKENQDEYKLLGYEASIYDTARSEKELQLMIRRSEDLANSMYSKIMSNLTHDKYDPLCSVDALPALRLKYYVDIFDELLNEWHGYSEYASRVVISSFIQRVVEMVMLKVVNKYKAKDIILVGGLFYNVKLNQTISDAVSGQTSIMPLAGDQGAAIGLYHYATNGGFKWPAHLFWGKRKLDYDKIREVNSPRLKVVSSDMETYDTIANLLESNCIVNIVIGDMEFGPRALGHTSTLALPLKTNVEYINHCNSRNTIMPMAGAMKIDHYHNVHENGDKIVKSLNYMICTRLFKPRMHEVYTGASHFSPTLKRFTGRTQMVAMSNPIHRILEYMDNFNMVINTSFNPHGKPIIYDADDIIHGHNTMKSHDPDNRVYTFVIDGEL